MLEEKLKAKGFSIKDTFGNFSYTPMITLSDALTICQQEIDAIRIEHREEGLLLLDKYNSIREQEIDEACKKQREICAKELFKKTERYNGDMVSEMGIIRNAPSPKESE